MYGQYKRIANESSGILTGKGLSYGGSLIRPEATGYGAVYFAENMLATRDEDFRGKVCAVSGSGNVAQYCTEKLNELGARVVTLSDSNGFIYDADGIDAEKLAYVMELKNVKRGRISEYVKKFPKATYTADQRPWSVKVDCAFPCATQNEISGKEAQTLVNNGCRVVSEGANMPSTPEAIEVFVSNKVLYAPGKAANAGGVAVSGLEMTQNAMRLSWSREEVDARLKEIMKNIHDNSWNAAKQFGNEGNYVMGANIAAFLKVANAMVAHGVV